LTLSLYGREWLRCAVAGSEPFPVAGDPQVRSDTPTAAR
jgi:hypothetical protein